MPTNIISLSGSHSGYIYGDLGLFGRGKENVFFGIVRKIIFFFFSKNLRSPVILSFDLWIGNRRYDILGGLVKTRYADRKLNKNPSERKSSGVQAVPVCRRTNTAKLIGVTRTTFKGRCSSRVMLQNATERT